MPAVTGPELPYANLAWNAPIPLESASAENPALVPHVVLEEHPSGVLTFDVQAAPATGVNRPMTDRQYAEQTVVQAVRSDGPDRQVLDPFTVYVLDSGDGLQLDDDGLRALAHFWERSGVEGADYRDMRGHPGYLGYAALGAGRHTYDLQGEDYQYTYEVTDNGLVLASLRTIVNRAASQAGITPMPLDVSVPTTGGWENHPNNRPRRRPRHAAEED